MGTLHSTLYIEFYPLLISPYVSLLSSKDTAGAERFAKVSRNYYRHGDGAMIVYDASRRDTLSSVQGWYDNLESHGPKASKFVAIVGNKSDLVSSTSWF